MSLGHSEMTAGLVLGIDGDDTLWHSEPHFAEVHERFSRLLQPWLGESDSAEELLLETERRNLAIFGYGIKGFVLSMIETAIDVSAGAVPAAEIARIVGWAKEMVEHPVELLTDVADTVTALAGTHRLVLVTKGDLFHQESKLARSGLADLFWRIEIVGDKDGPTYRRILTRHGIDAESFAMVGNSMRSDVVPVLELGGWGIHLPYPLTWELEAAPEPTGHPRYRSLKSFAELPELLRELDSPAS